ncbi:MAG: potassium transporter Kup [Ruminococcaceae bacterium]|nr:potassium transporter Kup [Oscillospiraceae bacterium]
MSTSKKKFQFSLFLVTIGIVYGDIGTSPLYVMKSIMEGNGGLANINEDFVIGALSLVIWTVTLLTTVKYVLIAMKADNHGEGGIFSIYALVRSHGKWLVIPAILGGAALLADGVLTPAVTVTTAVEGLRSIAVMNQFLGDGQWTVVLITLAIICILFSVQHAGTSKIGKAFGPAMLLWFSFLGVTGVITLLQYPVVLKAFNPVYAVQVLFSSYNKAGFMILGSVFLATTGAEALYSDMGHVGRENIYFSWPFVKSCLVLNYMGQGAWMIRNMGNEALASLQDMNPFFQMLPEGLRPVAVILSAMAAVIASQALITGSYTLVSEAIHLDLLPHLEMSYPSDTKGQLYIGSVNWLMWIGCTLVVLYFRSGHKIESAYGLAITITMLMTTLLIFAYLRKVRKRKLLPWVVLAVFGTIEVIFFVSSLGKFLHGGYFTALLTLLILILMVIWYRGTQLENRFRITLKLRDYIPILERLHKDESLPLMANNLVFLVKDDDPELIDRDILFSIVDKDHKRADAYWFISMNVLETPGDMTYEVETYGTDFIFHIRINLGFKCSQHVNVYLRQIVQDLQEKGELPLQDRKYSIYGSFNVGNFKFGVIHKIVPAKWGVLGSLDAKILNAKYVIRKWAGSKMTWYGLDTATLIVENVPLVIVPPKQNERIKRVERNEKNKTQKHW